MCIRDRLLALTLALPATCPSLVESTLMLLLAPALGLALVQGNRLWSSSCCGSCGCGYKPCPCPCGRRFSCRPRSLGWR
eukprot:7886779-Alexandrium_andersonii.AAC.1